MEYRIKINPSASNDLDEIIAYKEGQQDGSGIRFFNQFTNAIAILKINPNAFRIVKESIRKLNIRKTTYAVYYTVDDLSHIVSIKAVFNERQSPDKIDRKI